MSKSKGSISKGVDGVMIWLYLLLVGIGLLAIFAVTYKEGDPVISSFFSFKTDYSKQFYFFLIAIVL
jgi:rod shape determining protein RodA